MPEARPAPKLLLLLILGLSCLLRTAFITQESFWFDELYTLKQAGMTYSRMLVDLIQSDVHPPLYHSLMWVVERVVPANELTFRLPSMLFGVLGVLVLYSLGALLFDHRTGVVSALLLAVNRFAIVYSQEARSYSLLFLLTCLTSLCWWSLILKPTRWRKVCYGASAILLAYTHVYGLLFLLYLAVAYLVLAWFRRPHKGMPEPAGPVLALRFRDWVAVELLIGLAFVPWLPSLWLQAQRVREHFWVPVPRFYFAVQYLDEYMGVFGLGLLATGFIVAAVRAELREKRPGHAVRRAATWFMVGWVVYLLGVPFVVSRVSESILLSKYAISVGAPLLILLARGLLLLPGRASAVGVAVWSLFSLSLVVSTVYLKTNKEQWREVSQFVIPRYDFRSDVLAYYDPSNSQGFCYLYYIGRRLPITGVRGQGPMYSRTLREFQRRIADVPSAKRLWIIKMRRSGELPEALVRGWRLAGCRYFIGGEVYLLTRCPAEGS